MSWSRAHTTYSSSLTIAVRARGGLQAVFQAIDVVSPEFAIQQSQVRKHPVG